MTKQYAIHMTYFENNPTYSGYIVEEPTSHKSSYHTTSREKAVVFASRNEANAFLKELRAETWLLQYPDAVLEVVKV